MSRGEFSLRVIKGAFLFVGGRIEGVNGANGADTHTGQATGPAGHHMVWGGPTDKGYGVIVLNGEVTVTGRRGTVTLKQGQGTMPSPTANSAGGRLAIRRMKRAVASITFWKSPPARNSRGGPRVWSYRQFLQAAWRYVGQARRDEQSGTSRGVAADQWCSRGKRILIDQCLESRGGSAS